MEPALPSSPSRLNHHVVQAGAGAGKTRSLVEKVVSVFRHYRETEGRAPRLIVTTFTRKATQELRERLIVRACEERDAELLDYVGNARALHISTIHGVLNLFLSQVGHLCGLEAGFRIIQDNEERQIARVALKRTLLTVGENLSWVEDYSFQNLLSILIRFSNAFSQDPNIRPATLADLQAARKTCLDRWRTEMTAIADYILNWNAEDAKWNEFAQGTKAFAKVWDGSLAGFENRPEKPRKSGKSALTEEFQEEIAESLKKLKEDIEKFDANIEFWPHFAEKWESFFDFGRRFHGEFWRAKMNEGLLSNSDLEMFSLRQLRDQPALGGYFSASWDFWLIDEFQDTSPVQAELLQLLRGGSPSFVVGDPQQSIYLFRGAKSEMFLEVIKAAKKSGAMVDELMVNYRSEPALLEFLNNFFSSYSEQFQPMQPRQPVSEERLPVASFISGETVDAERNGILAHIHQLRHRGARYDEICVLGRTHVHLSEIAAVLKSQGIPVRVHSPVGFWRRREILDAMAFLKFLVHPHDNVTLLGLLRSPVFRMPDERLVEEMQKKPKSLWTQLLKKNDEATLRLRTLLEFRNEHGLVSAFEKGLRDSGLLDLAFLNDPTGRREANLWKIIARLKSEEKKPGFQVLTIVEEAEGWLGASELTKEGDATTAQEPNCVSLMTIHSSKGLEFEHVIIPRMGVGPNLTNSDDFLHHEEESIFTFRVYLEAEGSTVASPLDRIRLASLRKRELAEQDRWLYVALTRAKRSLAFCWSDDQIEKDSWASRGRLFAAERFSNSDKYAISIARPPFQFRFSGLSGETAAMPRPEWVSPKTKAPQTVQQSVTQLSKTKSDSLPIDKLRARQEGAAFGTLLHRAFQSLKAKPDLDWILKIHPELSSALRYVWDLETPRLRDLIVNGQAEWGFKVKTPTGVIQGRIDLWGRDAAGQLWIIDYKSGRVSSDESHWDQLQLYAWALRRSGLSEPMKMALIHPLHKSVLMKEFTDTDLQRFKTLYG